VKAADPVGVEVTVDAVHTCMIVRGVQQANTRTVTR
jgi:GTP cyclohydrolase I